MASAAGNALVFVMRARDSRKYIRVDVGWGYLLSTVAVLIAQSVIVAMQFNGWILLSGFCLTACILIQLPHCARMAIEVVEKRMASSR